MKLVWCPAFIKAEKARNYDQMIKCLFLMQYIESQVKYKTI